MNAKQLRKQTLITGTVALLAAMYTTEGTAKDEVCIEDQVSIRLTAPDGLFDDYSHLKFYGAQQMGVRPKYLAHIFLQCPREEDYRKAYTLLPTKGVCEGLAISLPGGSTCRIERIEFGKSK